MARFARFSSTTAAFSGKARGRSEKRISTNHGGSLFKARRLFLLPARDAALKSAVRFSSLVYGDEF
jgi:hypothetical protein